MGNGTPAHLVAKLEPMRERYVGTHAQWATQGLLVDVRILDVRYSFGRWSFEITPVLGTGRKWVASEKLAHEA
jgi:hypothetical protein